MTATPPPPAQGDSDDPRLAFMHRLQAVSNRIHGTRDAYELMLELSGEICALFRADRLTLYALTEDRSNIISRVKTGLGGFKELRLPVGPRSIAGYCAMTRRTVNIHDAHDDDELRRIYPELRFLSQVDERTGYRSREVLAVACTDSHNDLQGVLQLINTLDGGPFSDIVTEGAEILARSLGVALALRPPGAGLFRSKYDGLVAEGVLSAGELDLARRSARRKGKDIEDVLHGEFQVPLAALGRALAAFFDLPYEPFRGDRIRPVHLLRSLKREFVEANQWLPVEESEDGVVVISTDAERVRTSRSVQNVLAADRVAFRVTTGEEFRRTVDQFYCADDADKVSELLSSMDDEEQDSEAGDAVSAAADNELVRLVNKIIIDAFEQKASDIHIEPYPGRQKTVVRFRKDGELRNYIEVPASYRNALVTRIKIMCDLDISERRKPQDGKIRFRKFGPLDIELRVATLPSANGLEDVVMRVLASGEPIALDRLGLSTHNASRLRTVIDKPYGIFFVCGPTGSGKTTTLHSILGHLNTPERKIWTAEDPVEITQRGLRQVQINRKAGMDFATVMRAFLRADPDVIMVGEMRDHETVSIGIEASLTGHLVLSTLHTNSAPESVIRLLDMGMDPFNFSDALLGVLAQRLARRLCPSCREPYLADETEVDELCVEYASELHNTVAWRNEPQAAMAALRARLLDGQGGAAERITLYRARGCPACGGCGYAGRIGLHELMIGSDACKQRILRRAPVDELLASALDDGMRTLKMDGIEKVLAGLTDMRQVRQVCIK